MVRRCSELGAALLFGAFASCSSDSLSLTTHEPAETAGGASPDPSPAAGTDAGIGGDAGTTVEHGGAAGAAGATASADAGSAGETGEPGGEGDGGEGGEGGDPCSSGPCVVDTLSRTGMTPRTLLMFQRGGVLLVGDSLSQTIYGFSVLTLGYVGETALNPSGPPEMFDGDLSASVIDETTGMLFTQYGPPSDPGLAIIDLNTFALVGLLESAAGRFALDPERRELNILLPSLFGIFVADLDGMTVEPGPELPPPTGPASGFGIDTTSHDLFVGYREGERLDIVSGVDQSVRSVDGLDGNGLVVDSINHKVVGGLATLGGVWVYDAATDEMTSRAADWDGYPLLYSETTGRIYGTSEGGQHIGIYDGATDELTTLELPSSKPVVALGATRHVYYAGPTFTGVVDEDTLEVVSLAVASPSVHSESPYSAGVAHQESGKVFIVNDAEGNPTINVIEDAD